MTMQFSFDNSYARLPPQFFARVEPSPVPAPRLVQLNRALAAQLGIDPDALTTPEGVEVLAGLRIPEGAEPLAMAYAGHQFGQFVPQLGDGRAILLGEVVDRDGVRRDIQLKGAGPTPFSRRGDGRAALGPVLREYLVSEAMAALGIPTTRALAAVATGDTVVRERILPGAVLTRVASSHVRVGTFQFFAARGDTEALMRLTEHVIARHYPEAVGAANPALAFLDGVVARQAALVARWLLVGFIHGVMNTDNMSVAGETIDYGPCAFMDAYDPATVFSSIDQFGRYAYANQPGIAQWNLARLAECLIPLLAPEPEAGLEIAKAAVGRFKERFETAYLDGLRGKLGLSTREDDDSTLIDGLLARMAGNQADFTLVFRRLGRAALGPEGDADVRALFKGPEAFDAWAPDWRARLARDGGDAAARKSAMDKVNPAFIPRNHRVEAALEAAIERNDYAPFETLLAVLARPYDDQPSHSEFTEPPPDNQRVYQTFCGT